MIHNELARLAVRAKGCQDLQQVVDVVDRSKPGDGRKDVLDVHRAVAVDVTDTVFAVD